MAGVGTTLFNVAFPTAGKLLEAHKQGKLNELVLQAAFPNFYNVRQKLRNARNKDKKEDEYGTPAALAITQLTAVTVQTNDLLGVNSELLAQQNQILMAILNALESQGGHGLPNIDRVKIGRAHV